MIYNYINYLRINRGLSEHTLEAYEKSVRSFAKFIEQHYPGTRWTSVSKNMLDEYVAKLVSENLAPSTIKQHLAAIRTLYKTMQALGYKGENPARYVSTPKKVKTLPNTIEPRAIERAIEAPTTPRQAKAIIAIIYETGIRLQELLDIQPKDINSQEHSIKIQGKGRKERFVYYGKLTQQYGGKLQPQTLTQREARKMVYDALKPFSKANQLSPHAIRHTFASKMLNAGAPIEFISKILGHENTKTTDIYAQLSNKKAHELYLQYSL